MKGHNVADYYYYYYLMVDHTKALLHLARNLRHSFTEEQLGMIAAPVPPVDEQVHIAAYLDRRCAEIDSIATDIQSQIDTLEQCKRSVITETVTSGVNPDAEMKDSEIQWIGMMPAHWNCIRGKYVLKYVQKPVREDDGVITCFRDGEVTLRSNRREDGFTMADKEIGYQGIDIKASNFVQKKIEEHTAPNLVASPVMKLPTAEHFGLTEDKEKRLSEIIDEINSRTGKSYDNDVVVKAMLQIRDILMKSEKLKTSAKNNTQQDFEFSYFDDIDDALIEGLSQNQDFFSLLLSNDEMKRQVLGIFADEIYKSLRSAD